MFVWRGNMWMVSLYVCVTCQYENVFFVFARELVLKAFICYVRVYCCRKDRVYVTVYICVFYAQNVHVYGLKMYVHMCICKIQDATFQRHMYIHASTHVCLYVCIYIYIYVCMYMHLHMYVCMHLHMCVCMHTCMLLHMYVSMYECIYTCMYACAYISSIYAHPPGHQTGI